jgi:hypothetical protein
MWFIESRCPQTIKQLKAYRWAENASPRTDEKRREKVFKLNDELCDCFIAGTLISSNKGNIPVEQIKVGDLVHTRKGFKSVEAIGGRILPTYELTFSNGNNLIGTATHPIWSETKHDFIPLIDFEIGDSVHTCTQTTIEEKHVNYGNRYMGLFQPTIKSITGIKIRPITAWKIWNAFRPQSISEITCLIVQSWKERVYTALRAIRQKIQNEFGVPILANLQLVGTQELTIPKEFVLSVQKSLRARNIQNKNIVQENVVQDIILDGLQLRNASTAVRSFTKLKKQNGVVTVVGRRSTGNLERVYNLSVVDQPEYFANNILVHNCVRYSVMTWPILPKAPPLLAVPERDLSLMPDEMRASIQRMRKLDKDPSLPLPQDVTQDFWL